MKWRECECDFRWIGRVLRVLSLSLSLGLIAAGRLAAEEAPVKPAETTQKPNVLFLFADDLTWRAVHALSGEDVETPNLDRLAARGTTFTHTYHPGGWHGAICVASRTMLMTGKPLWKAKEAEKSLNREEVPAGRLWPQLLAAQGYRTCMAGKWHIQADPRKAFQEVVHLRKGGMAEGYEEAEAPQAYYRPVAGQPDWDAGDSSLGGLWAGGKHWSEVMVDDFTELLGKSREDARPWFMYLAFNAPHDPRQSPREYLDRYPLSRIKLPPNYLPLYPERQAMGADKGLRDEDLAPFPRTELAVLTHRREYFAVITHLDAQIGRILDELDRSPARDRTYIFFTADHGLSCGEHGLLGKQNLFDASVRVPFFVAGPGVPAGKKVDAPVYLQDAMPTVLKLAGAAVPPDNGFRDLQPLWQGGGTPRKAIMTAYRDLQRMVEEGGMKLILYPKVPAAKLFDLRQDPWETRDLSGTPEGRAAAVRLFARLRELQPEQGDTLSLAEIYPELAAAPKEDSGSR